MSEASNRTEFSGSYNYGQQVGQNISVHYHFENRPGEDATQVGDTNPNNLNETEQRCHRLFRSDRGEEDPGYEWYKSRIDDRIAGTCEWFLSHPHYRAWSQQSSGPLLVSADPGCGKSVLAKYLVDHELSGTICYFFFKDQDQNRLKQALCALLHQLFTQQPHLLQFAVEEYLKNGSSFVEITESLWKILQSSIQDMKAGTIIFVLDALDECSPSDIRQLIQGLTKQFSSEEKGSSFKLLFTSRPYQTIVSEFWELMETFPEIRIPGEKYSAQIGREVDCVIRHRVDLMTRKFKLKDILKEHLLTKLLHSITNRTYLWVYLVFEHLDQGFKKTVKGIESLIDTLPESVNDAYEKILTRSTNRDGLRNAASIMLAARRPLTLEEMNLSISLIFFPLAKCVDDLDLEDTDDFQNTLRDWCGLFVNVYDGKVFFLHQTAREFLIHIDDLSLNIIPSNELWKGSIRMPQAHSILAKSCILYLILCFTKAREHSVNGAKSVLQGMDSASKHKERDGSFKSYAFHSWSIHFREGNGNNEPETKTLVLEAIRSFQPDSWFGIFWNDRTHRNKVVLRSALMIASAVGFVDVLEELLKTEDVNQQASDGTTALHLAARGNHADIVRHLIQKGAKVDICTEEGFSPLHMATVSRSLRVTEILLDAGALVNGTARNGETPLSKMIIDKAEHRAPIRNSALNGTDAAALSPTEAIEGILRKLLEYGADVNIGYPNGTAVLHKALQEQLPDDYCLVASLLDAGADTTARDEYDRTPLHRVWSAAWDIHDSTGRFIGLSAALVRLLVSRGVDVNASDCNGETALFHASIRGHVELVSALLACGADINHTNGGAGTALIGAMLNGWGPVARFLATHGADLRCLSARQLHWLDLDNSEE